MICTSINEFSYILHGSADVKSATELLMKTRRGEERRISIAGEKVRCENYMHEIWVADQVQTISEILGIDPTRREKLVIAAILHDLYEDFHISEFGCGEEISSIVFEVSKNHADYRGYSGMTDNAMIVKTADRLVNLTTCVGVFSSNKIQNYHSETQLMIEAFISSGTEIGGKCAELLQLGVKGELKYGNDLSV